MSVQSPLLSFFLEKLKEQTFVVVIICFVTYYFYTKTEKLEQMVADCNKHFNKTLLDIISKDKSSLDRPMDDLYNY